MLQQPLTSAPDRRSILQGGALSAVAGSLGCLGPCLCCPAVASAEVESLKLFPGCVTSSEIDIMTHGALAKRGFTAENTLFADSVCSDEVNYEGKEMIELMKKRWGEGFSLGGLAGVPFAGKAGLAAYAHHVPDSGKLFIVFAPHVGVSKAGEVGPLERQGQGHVSNACGAGIGAFKALSKPDAKAPDMLSDLDNTQIEWIMLKLAPKLAGIDNAPDKIAFVTYQMYEIVRDQMLAQIKATPAIWDDCTELAVLGGIQINRAKGLGDAFMPLMFQTTTKEGVVTNLYEEAFGSYPEISTVLGSRSLASSTLYASL